MTTQKPYEKPAMQVFELRQQPQLLAGSEVPMTNSINDWDFGGSLNNDGGGSEELIF